MPYVLSVYSLLIYFLSSNIKKNVSSFVYCITPVLCFPSLIAEIDWRVCFFTPSETGTIILQLKENVLNSSVKSLLTSKRKIITAPTNVRCIKLLLFHR